MANMTPQQRASYRRHYCCSKCGSAGLEPRDGSEVGGMPGIIYQYCAACGHAQPPKPKRLTKKELQKQFH